ncbi:vitellogenin-like isoform X2 [Narcine bancroftii]|uniref:vitellogenin-like isoform X2 n=1 Tax=Narcine bancroftii TaxID=1343680 RepID=UPI0038320EB6
MRALTFILIVSVAGSQKLKYEPNFREGLTHVYKYEGVILTGLPQSGLSRAGVKINCGLSIVPEGHASYLLKITDFQILEYNGVWPSHPFISAHKLTQRLAPQVTQPVKFEYSNGQVGSIFAPAELPEDILNIHRGILNIFQITIKKLQNFYELQEAGIEGICLTSYIIQQSKKANRITVTKSKDLNNCQEKVMLFTGAAYASRCPAFEKTGRNIRASSTFTHVLKPTISGAILQEARVREVHQFTPFHELDGSAVIEAEQNLVLVAVKAAVISLPQVQFVKHGTLKYRYSQGVLPKPVQLTHPQNVKKAILETLTNLEIHHTESVHSDTPAKFLQLVHLLRSASTQTVSDVWEKNHSSQFRRWMLFALPAAGTVDALRFIKAKIQRYQVTKHEAAQILVLALHQVTANLDALSLVRELLGMVQVQQSSILRPLVFLGYGSMVYRYCAERLTCPDKILALLHGFLATSATRGNEEDLVLALKAIGNAGQPASIKHLVKFLPSSRSLTAKVPQKIQVDVIMAFRNILKKDPAKVQAITLQIFMNKQNHVELRTSACAVYLCSKPPLNALLVLANSLLTETSLQVASFAYSQFRSLARSSLPSLKPLAAVCKIALKYLGARFEHLGFRFSQVLHPDVFSYKLMAGAAAKVIVLHDAGMVIPSVTAAKFSGYMMGGFGDLLEVGLRMEGLQEAVTKSWKKAGRILDMKQMQRILSKFPDLKSVPEKMPLASAYLKLFNQEIAFVDIRRDSIHKALQMLNGVDDRQGTLRKIIHQLREPVELRPAAAFMALELRRSVPTCMGLSTELSLVSASVAKASLHVEANFSASTSTFSQLLGANIVLKTQINPSLAVYNKASMGISAPFIQSGLELTAKVHSSLPVDVLMKLNVKEGSLQIHSVPVQQENPIMTLKSQVFAVSRSHENLVTEKVTPFLPEIKEANIMKQKFKTSQETQSDTDIYSKIGLDGEEFSDRTQWLAPQPWIYKSCSSLSNFAFEVCLDAKVANVLYVRHSPLYRLLGTHVARVLIRPVPSESDIQSLILEVQVGPKASSKMVRLLEKEELPLKQTYGRTVLLKESHAQSRLNKQTGIEKPSSHGHSSQGSSSSWTYSLDRPHGTSLENSKEAWRSGNSTEHNPSLKSRSVSVLSRLTQLDLLGALSSPLLTVIAKATRSDGNLQGYQLTGSMDSARGRPTVQLRMVELADDSRWKLCVDASSPTAHRAMVIYRWGVNCQRYRMSYQASLGYLGNHPALKLQTKWASIPQELITGGKMIGSALAYLLGFSNSFRGNPPHQITQLIVLTSPRTVDTIVKLPRVTIYYRGFELPLPVNIPVVMPRVRGRQLGSVVHLPHFLLTMNQKECVAKRDRVVTFDGSELNYRIPNNCFYVLTKDCSSAPTFILLMRRITSQQAKKRIKLLISAPNTVIEAYPMQDRIKLLMDSVEATVSEQQTVLKDIITIQRNGTGITLQIPSINIEKLYFDGDQVKITLDHMMGKTCGICGLNNGEQKLIMPNQEEAKDQEHLYESWLCSGTSCKDDCRVRKEFVELGQVVEFDGEESRCYSVEPVQRCLAQCTPLETRSRSVNFHCVPSNRTVNIFSAARFRWKATHISHPMDSHTDCSCECIKA